MMEGKYYSPVKSQWDADSQISRRPVIRGDDLLIEVISSVTKKLSRHYSPKIIVMVTT